MENSIGLPYKREFLRQVYAVTISVCAVIQLVYLVRIFMHPLELMPYYKLFSFFFSILFLSIGLLFIKKAKVNILSWYFVVCCYLTLVYYTSITGGLIAPGVIWFLICPIISFLILSKQVATLWLWMVLITLCAFHFFKDVLVVDEFSGKSFWYLLSYGLFLLTSFRLSKVFIKIIDGYTSKLLTLNHNLLEKQAGLLLAQAEIESQYNKLEIAEQKALARTERLELYLNRMLDISRMEELHIGSLQYAVRSIEQTLRESFQLNCVTVWIYNETDRALKSFITTDNVTEVLKMNDFRKTFELLEAGAIVTMSNDNSLEDLTALKHQLGVSCDLINVLGCPFFIDGKFYGMITCVAQDDRQWETEDIIFIRAVADALCLSFKSDQRRENQLLLQEKQLEITKLNESLEEKVTARSKELELRNKQLLDFAFINAHEVRGPLCRLLGLRNLLNITNNPDQVKMIHDYISASIVELDEITRKASKLLADTIQE